MFTTLSRHVIFYSMTHKICTWFACECFVVIIIILMNQSSCDTFPIFLRQSHDHPSIIDLKGYGDNRKLPNHNKTGCKPYTCDVQQTASYWCVASCSAPDCHVSYRWCPVIIRLRKILLLYCLLHILLSTCQSQVKTTHISKPGMIYFL